MTKFGDAEIRKAKDRGLPPMRSADEGYWTIEKRLTDLRDDALTCITPKEDVKEANNLKQNLGKAGSTSPEYW